VQKREITLRSISLFLEDEYRVDPRSGLLPNAPLARNRSLALWEGAGAATKYFAESQTRDSAQRNAD
jgi:hypothetical protein